MRHLALILSSALWASCASTPKLEQAPLKTAPSTQAAEPADAKDYWQGRSDLIAPPELQPPEALRLPPLHRLQLKNGLAVVLLPDQQLPLVSVQLILLAGAIDEPPGKAGLAEFTAAMLRQGTRRLSADAISEAVDTAGARLAAGSSYELSSISCSARQQELELCLRMVADLAFAATFPEQELGEVRDRLLGAVRGIYDDPATLAELHFNNLLYGDDHPAGRTLSQASVTAISREDLIGFYRARYRPGSAILGVSGAMAPVAAERAVRRIFGRWAGGEAPARQITPVQNPPVGLRLLLVDKPDLSQSFFALGHAGVKFTTPDRPAVKLMNYVLGGGGFSSRLMTVVRAEGGKTYGIRSSFNMDQADGKFVVQSFTRHEQLVPTLALVRQELEALGKRPPSAAEILGAKGDIAGGYAIRLQTPEAITNRLLQAQLWGLPDTFVTDYPLRIWNLAQEQVAQAARAHIYPDRLVGAVVGRAEVVAPLLRAAKIPFERINYLAPISVRARQSPTAPAPGAGPGPR